MTYPEYRMAEITDEVERLRAELAIAHPLNSRLARELSAIADERDQLRADRAELLALLKKEWRDLDDNDCECSNCNGRRAFLARHEAKNAA